MAATKTPSSGDFAPTVRTTYATLALTALRLLFVTILANDNPLLWNFLHGKHNPQADMEGPAYIVGPPSRQIGEGKGVLASNDDLKKFAPFLLTIRVLTPDGKPVCNATIDLWQADSAGSYYVFEYGLRGKVVTDANGYVEVLTVPPGEYGPMGLRRPGHIHAMISPSKEDAKRWDGFTTQLYVCAGNTPKTMGIDFLNKVRTAREGNMLPAWCIPSANGGEAYKAFPELPADDIETWKRVEYWNCRLAEKGDLKVVAGTSVDLKLNAKKSGWF